MIFTILNKLKPSLVDCVMIGDRGYLSQAYQHDLFTSRQIKLANPYATKPA